MAEIAQEGPGAGVALIVTDVAAIPAEPPDDIWYHHQVGLTDSVKKLWAHREIVYTLAERDFRAQYKQATLGILWSVVTPLVTLAIFVIVFSRVKSFPHQGVPYALYSFVGILCWSYFASSVNGGGQSLLANKALLAKTQFPRECFPLELMLGNALSTVISWVPLAVLFVIFGRAPRVATLYTPMFIIVELIFAAGVTLAFSALIIQMRDLAQVLPIMVSLGIFFTPVIWPFSYIPAHYHLFGTTYINLQEVYGFFNPLGPIINSLRLTMLLGHSPQWGPMGAATVGALVYLVLGYRIFKKLEVNFADIA